MGVASGLSLAFVPFEFKGATGWKRASPEGAKWIVTKGARGNRRSVLLRDAPEV